MIGCVLWGGCRVYGVFQIGENRDPWMDTYVGRSSKVYIFQVTPL